jgi:hypothetical protein
MKLPTVKKWNKSSSIYKGMCSASGKLKQLTTFKSCVRKVTSDVAHGKDVTTAERKHLVRRSRLTKFGRALAERKLPVSPQPFPLRFRWNKTVVVGQVSGAVLFTYALSQSEFEYRARMQEVIFPFMCSYPLAAFSYCPWHITFYSLSHSLLAS